MLNDSFRVATSILLTALVIAIAHDHRTDLIPEVCAIGSILLTVCAVILFIVNAAKFYQNSDDDDDDFDPRHWLDFRVTRKGE